MKQFYIAILALVLFSAWMIGGIHAQGINKEKPARLANFGPDYYKYVEIDLSKKGQARCEIVEEKQAVCRDIKGLTLFGGKVEIDALRINIFGQDSICCCGDACNTTCCPEALLQLLGLD